MTRKRNLKAIVLVLVIWTANSNADVAAQDKADKSSNKPAPAPKELVLKLTLEDMSLILESLGALPFAKSYQLVVKIQAQAAEQLRAAPAASPQPKKTP